MWLVASCLAYRQACRSRIGCVSLSCSTAAQRQASAAGAGKTRSLTRTLASRTCRDRHRGAPVGCTQRWVTLHGTGNFFSFSASLHCTSLCPVHRHDGRLGDDLLAGSRYRPSPATLITETSQPTAARTGLVCPD